MKRYFFTVVLIVGIIFSYIKLAPLIREALSVYKGNVSYISKVDDKYFYKYKFGHWDKEFIKGVNLGVGKPGYFPGEHAITKEEYLRWFQYIGEMNANTIRVYTILKPEFYEALYEYNRNTSDTLYLMHGIWVNEEDISNYENAYDSNINDKVNTEIKNIIDVIHGKANIEEKSGHAGGIYTRDVSKYISAWILGIEWDPNLVIKTNEKNQDKPSFIGEYLYSKDASPFEVWLAKIGDYSIKYETEKYKMQRPLSFTNWVTTDMLSHSNEPSDKEDIVSVNPEHIKESELFEPGLFAAYHIYPYYPDFMNYQKEYIDFKDENGKINTYRAYLKDLIKEHTMPVLVAEFGIPASRGLAHENIHMGLNQGHIDEKTQGEMDIFMLKNIYEEGYAGGLVFTWQDEWFKRTWNTMDFDIPDRRPYWSNTQTNEQQFGLLAFDPGEVESTCYVDSEVEEWIDLKAIVSNEKGELYVKSDEKYVYFMVYVKNYNIDKDKIIIPIDSKEGQGNTYASDFGLKFLTPADFLIIIDGKNNSRILVDSYYDSFYYMYSKLKMIEKVTEYESKNNSIFNPMYLALNKELYIPIEKVKIPFSKFETGKLLYGNSNPRSQTFDSLSDFFNNGDYLEIRIPWQLINIMDPSSKMAMDDLYIDGIKPTSIEGIKLSLIVQKDEKIYENKEVGYYSWDKWEQPTYHERLKPSYDILKNAFKEIGVK